MNEEVNKEQLSEMVASTRISKGIDGKPTNLDTDLRKRIASLYGQRNVSTLPPEFENEVDLAFALMLLPIVDEIKLVRKLLHTLSGERFYVMVNVDDVNTYDKFEELRKDFQKLNPQAFVFMCSNNERDFAEMRNRFLDNEQIKGIVRAKWLYFIDADEMIERFQLIGLRNHLNQNPDVEVAKIWNVEAQPNEIRSYHQMRLVKTTSNVRWIGACHENLDMDATYKKAKCLYTDVIQYHRGYIKAGMEMYVAKLQRNLEGLSYGIVQFYENARKTGKVQNWLFHHYVEHLKNTTVDLFRIKELAENGVKNENN